jgi:hypothetical protein
MQKNASEFYEEKFRMQPGAIRGKDRDTDGGADFAMGAAVNIVLDGMIRLAFLRDQGRRLVDDFDGDIAVVFPEEMQPDYFVEFIETDRRFHYSFQALDPATVHAVCHRFSSCSRLAGQPAFRLPSAPQGWHWLR